MASLFLFGATSRYDDAAGGSGGGSNILDLDGFSTTGFGCCTTPGLSGPIVSLAGWTSKLSSTILSSSESPLTFKLSYLTI